MSCLYRIALATTLLLAFALPIATFADSSTPLSYLSIAGTPLSIDDIVQLEVRIVIVSIRGTTVEQDASAMPALTPHVAYEGTDKGKAVFWMVKSANSDPKPTQQAMIVTEQEQIDAAILAVLDAGTGGTALQSVYANTPADPQHRLALARQIAQAMNDASRLTSDHSRSERRWILANIHADTPRAAVRKILTSRGLKLVPQAKPGSVDVVTFPGQFEPGCSFSTEMEFTFDASDLLEKIDVDQPRPNCL